MGDILHALPAVTALRRAHPEWVIDWVVEPRWKALLMESEAGPDAGPLAAPETGRAGPVVDRIHLAATKEWRRSASPARIIGEVRTLRNALRAGCYDVVLDLQGAIRSAVIARMAGSRRVIGSATPREAAARLMYTEQVRTAETHVIVQAVEIAAAIAGDLLEQVAPLLPRDTQAETWAAQRLTGLADGPVVLINPGAGWGAKRWPAERYAAVGRALAAEGCNVFVNAGPGEEHLAAPFRAFLDSDRILSCTLDQLIAFTRRVDLLIAGDTGPMHLACALQRPVVAVFGPTDPARNGPFGTEFRVIRSPLSLRDYSHVPDIEAGLLAIEPDEVLRAVRELLQSRDAHQKGTPT